MEKLEEFKKKLQEIFEMDKSDLDFGIYRIMNQKRKEINQFIDNLSTDVTNAFSSFKDNNLNDKKLELEKLETSLKEAEVPLESSGKYQALKAELESMVDVDSISSEVFSNLITFFSRYYVEGDFISQRRYKEGVYAIPYEGEEVKLYWANSDQYYIKNSEYFNNYSVKLNEKTLNFKINEVITEINNNKEAKGKERRFVLDQNKPLEILENEINIYFTYNLNPEKQDKLNELTKQSISEILKAENEEIYNMVFQLSPTEKNKNRTLFEKELLDYTSKNTFDYFIHKNLGEFLRRELDFFLKNEVLFIDDLNEEKIKNTIGKAKVIKSIGHKIIDFLAQVEDFEKKLWEKKKFIVETNYCITLDKIPEEFYEEIISNEDQQDAWKELFGIEKNVENLKENPYLVLDTKHFSQSFKENLIASIDNLDENINGIMIHSDNYQGLNILQENYKEKIKNIYTDPPYNTNASEILYKNGYKDSSWISLMSDRLELSKKLLSEDGLIEVAIDDMEHRYLILLMEQIYNKNNFISNIPIMHNPKGRDAEHIASAHEYLILFSKAKEKLKTNDFKHDDSALGKKYPLKDEDGCYRELPLKRTGSDSLREERPYMYFPFVYDKNKEQINIIPTEEYKYIYDDETKSFNDKYVEDLKEKYAAQNLELIFPVREDGVLLRWRWGYDTCVESLKTGEITYKKTGETAIIYAKDRENSGYKPKSLWYGERYDASSKGTNLLKDLFNDKKFDFPKSLYAVMDAITIGASSRDYILDYFAGSGTTGHAVIELNRGDNGNRKYILIEMGEYFNKVTRPRVMKSVYSANWKNGKPLSPETGVSHIMKYFKLEQYEDTLNNLSVSKKLTQQDIFAENQALQDEYTMKYMLEFDTRGSQSLLNIDQFKDPFNYKMNIVENNEIKTKTMDLVETFNYLIGLEVEKNQATRYFNFEGDKLRETTEGNYKIKEIIGNTRNGERVLIIWRNRTDDIIKDNKVIEEFFRKNRYKTNDNEFSKIYINGDNTLQNIKIDESWKVELLEEKFKQMMFNEQGL